MSIRVLYLISIFTIFSTVSAAGRGPRGTRGQRGSFDHRITQVAPNDTTPITAPTDVKTDKKGSKKAPKKRDCDIKEKTTRVEYKCKTNLDDTGGIQDEIGFAVDTSDGLKVNVQYRETIVSNTSNTDTNTEYEISFDRVIEYTKPNGTSHRTEAYIWEKDNVVQELQLMDWLNFSGVVNNTGGVVSSFYVTSVDRKVMFTFKMATSDTGNMTANSMKIDFELMNFPWMKTDSYVALISTVTSSKTVGVHELTKNLDVSKVSVDFIDAVNTVGFVPFGAFTWATTADATINGTGGRSSTIDVIATAAAPSRRRLLVNGTVETIAFSFVGDAAKGSSDIYWDPEAGIGYNTSRGSSGGRVGVYVGSIVGVLAFIGLIVGLVMIRKRRNQRRAVRGAKSPTLKSNGEPVPS